MAGPNFQLKVKKCPFGLYFSQFFKLRKREFASEKCIEKKPKKYCVRMHQRVSCFQKIHRKYGLRASQAWLQFAMLT